MTQDRPPATVQVRLSAIESDGYPLQARGIAYLVRETGEKIMCLTMTIGCLVIQVFGGPGAGTDALRSAGRTGADFAAIFPPQTQPARWPPRAVLGDENLSAFADPWPPSPTDPRKRQPAPLNLRAHRSSYGFPGDLDDHYLRLGLGRPIERNDAYGAPLILYSDPHQSPHSLAIRRVIVWVYGRSITGCRQVHDWLSKQTRARRRCEYPAGPDLAHDHGLSTGLIR
jgi:hypothetical protein